MDESCEDLEDIPSPNHAQETIQTTGFTNSTTNHKRNVKVRKDFVIIPCPRDDGEQQDFLISQSQFKKKNISSHRRSIVICHNKPVKTKNIPS